MLTYDTDGRDLVVAKFFFWKPGTPKQKSLDGLYRSLLYDVFNARPELIPEAMPELWKAARAMPWQAQTLAIPEKDIRTAFSRLIRITSHDDKKCFCFFIDGLDEYQETAQNDHKEMVGLLKGWTTAARRQVKLCVSSREDNVFLNAFEADKRLRLHDLTRFDMEAYARDKLDEISDRDAKESLTLVIVDKAEGIFLWVALVVKRMRDELENGADPAALLGLVDSMPDELDSLFEHILNSLSKPDRRKAYQTLAILSLSTTWTLPVSLFAYSFLDRLDADTTFAERDDFTQKSWGGMTAEERIQLGRKRVNGWCRGLVESRDGATSYTHRSIPEFLASVKAEMESVLAGFNPAEALSQLVLAELRLKPNHASTTVGDLINMRHDCNLDHAPFTFLRMLDAAAGRDVWGKDETGTDTWLPAHRTGTGPCDIATHRHSWNRFTDSAMYHCTMQFANHEYPTWKISNDPTATDSAAKVARIAYAVFMRQLIRKAVNLSF